MSANTKIEWCDSTFNPFIGCTKVSPGCDNCYAESMMDKRLHQVQWGAGAPRRRTSAANWRKPLAWNAAHAEFHAQHGRRQRVFCASLADVFDNEVDSQWRADLFDLIEQTPNIDWLILTKRIGNVCSMIPDRWSVTLPDNVWLGATICNQAEADRDIPKLLRIKVKKRFLSMEPLLGRVYLRLMERSFGFPNHTARDGRAIGMPQGIHWVIAGGESGRGARPMHPSWVRDLRDQCVAAGVPFLFKQHGEYVEADLSNACMAKERRFIEIDGTDSTDWTIDRHTDSTAHMVRVGKKAAGRLLDGREWNEFPDEVLP